MTTTLSPIDASLLEKAASDNGFDNALAREGDWLVFASTLSPLRIWLGVFAPKIYLVGLSMQNVADALAEYGTPMLEPLPSGAKAGRTVTSIAAMHTLLRRAMELSRALPNEPLYVFERRTAKMPQRTEAERLVVQRVGQEIFRDGLLTFWEQRCAVTGLAVPELLRASHIKPWASCETDAERLDVYNGVLLSPNLDAAFDRGFITFDDNGALVLSKHLPPASLAPLGLDRPLRIRRLTPGHQRYLPWHHQQVFKG